MHARGPGGRLPQGRRGGGDGPMAAPAACMQGMQLNPNVRTIESELVKALIATHAAVDRPAGSTARAPAAPLEAGDCLRAVKWSRAARTDKGVSACGQVVSAWLWLEPNLAAKLNAVLPPQIRVLGFTCALPPPSSTGAPI